MLPVYMGQRYQRGGGILPSIAQFVMPTVKKLLRETVKATPRMIDSIVNDKQSVKTAVLGGLKTAGRKTARDTLNHIGVKLKGPTPSMRPCNKKPNVLPNVTNKTMIFFLKHK